MFFSRSCLDWLGRILQRDSIRKLGNRVGYSRPRSFCKKNKVSECAERFCIKKLIINRGTNMLKELSELVLLQLMGYCHEIFNFRFFSWISFSQAPEYPAVSNYFENLRRYSQLKVHHWCR